MFFYGRIRELIFKKVHYSSRIYSKIHKNNETNSAIGKDG